MGKWADRQRGGKIHGHPEPKSWKSQGNSLT